MAILDRESIEAVSLQLRSRNHFNPRCTAREFHVRLLDRACLERTRFGKVAAEETGVDDHVRKNARQSQLQHAPVVTGSAAAAGFPSVHPLATVGVLVLDPDRLRCLD